MPLPVVGGVIEYPVAGGDVSLGDMTAGPDGNLWFIDNGVPARVGRITPAGVVTAFVLPAKIGVLRSITNGPDGNLWMTAASGLNGVGSWIVRITPNGLVAKFPVPDTSPNGITAGPDGNMWFTEFFSAVIVQMSTDGVILNQFPAPRVGLDSIVTGPDGNLWFTETDPNLEAIARMTTSGVVTEFPLSHGIENQVGARAIAIGPDHNIWFAETGKIGRITPAGAITLFGGAGATRMATGPDGNLWFTGRSASDDGAVGRITPSGTIRLFELPAGNASEPSGIAAGSDGRMWFTQWGVNRIGSIGERVPEVRLGSRLLNFGTEHIAATRTVTITSSGDAGVTVSTVKVVGADQGAFAVTRDTCTGRTVATGATCQVDVALVPGSVQGILSARLTLTDNATGSPRALSLVAQLPDCRLPVFTRTDAPPSVRGAFLNFRTGVVEPDAGGIFQLDIARGLYRSKTTPTLFGAFPWALYDSVGRRWLPADSQSISPDHSRYAYVARVAGTINSVVHVVDAATGSDRALKLPAGPWNVLAFTSEGIYVHRSYEFASPGLTIVNPDSGVVRTVFTDDIVQAVGEGAAWVGARNAKDPLPEPGGIGNGSNQLVRRDLVTGQKTVWLYASGAYVYASAVGSGRVVATANFKHGSQAWILRGPNQSEPLTFPETGVESSFGAFLADPMGIWFHGDGGIYLWRPGIGTILVSTATATPVGSCA